MNGIYEGTLSADGNSISGNWSQGGPYATPLTLARATAETAWTIPGASASAEADVGEMRIRRFVVATIKPSNPNAQGQGYGFRGPGRDHHQYLSELAHHTGLQHARPPGRWGARIAWFRKV